MVVTHASETKPGLPECKNAAIKTPGSEPGIVT